MTPTAAAQFVETFAEQRARGRGEALWHPHGRLHYPFANRVIEGRELGAFNDLMQVRAPHLTWEMIGWTHRDAVIVVEWRTTNRYGEQTVVMTGVDRLTLKDGRIIEEIVYADTAPLRAMREGGTLEPVMPLPEKL